MANPNFLSRSPVQVTVPDSVAYSPRRFTVDEYYRLAELGILEEEDRVELLDGCIVLREPAGPSHSGHTIRLTNLLSRAVGDRALVSVQNPLEIDAYNHPQPDLLVLRPRQDFYTTAHPRPDDVYLLIEVSLSSVTGDRRVKAPLYAGAGIREYWIVDLKGGLIEVYRKPSSTGYDSIRRLNADDVLSPEALPGVELAARDVINF